MFSRLISHAQFLLSLTGLVVFSAVSGMAQSGPRPYLQQIGSEEDVLSMSVARNGHSFKLLSNNSIIVAGPDQLLRPPLTHSALNNARALAVSPSGESDDPLVELYIVTATSVNKITYNCEERTLAATTSAAFAFPGDQQYFPTAITVAPDNGGTPGSVFVGGQTKPTGSGDAAQRNFLIKLNPSLVQQGATRQWGVPTTSTNLASDGVNHLHAITADASGNVYVAGQWPAVYRTDRINYWNLLDRSPYTWSVPNLGGLSGLSGSLTIQTSARRYFYQHFWWFINYRTDNIELNGDAENRTAYVLKFNASLNPSNYSHTTNQVPNYTLWTTGAQGHNYSSFNDLRCVGDDIYAIGNWQGQSDYSGQLLPSGRADIQVLKFSTSLSLVKKARVNATGTSHPGFALDADPDTKKVFVTGVTEDGANNFVSDNGTTFQTVSGRGLFISQLSEDLNWTKITKSNTPAPSAFRGARLRWNIEAKHSQVAGTFTAGQLSLGLPSRPALVPSGAVAGNVNYYALAGEDGNLINQINVIIRSEFVQGSQILTRLGDNPPVPLTNFDPSTREGAVGLLSDSSGASVTISVPPNIYFDVNGGQVYPTFQGGNEIAPDNAVSRHRCTGFSVSGEATTGATNTYTFAVSSDTKVIFNWLSEHALQIFSEVTNDLGLPANTAALGNPEPTVKKHWITANEPVTTFIDNAALEPAVYGKRYRVTGFDATGSVLDRGTGLPPLPSGRLLRTAGASIAANGLTVTPTQPLPLQVGWLVSGPGVAPDTTIVSISYGANDNAASFTLSQAATPGNNLELQFENSKIRSTVATTLELFSTSVILAQATGVRPGWQVSGPGIAAGTTVASVTSPTQITLSKATVPIRRSARTTAPQPMPVVQAITQTTAGSTIATIGGEANVSAEMLIAEVGGTIASGTSVSEVTNNSTPLSTILTNGSNQATIPYTDGVTIGAPVSGIGIPANTVINDVVPTSVAVNAVLTSGSNQATLPATTDLPLNIPVIDSNPTPAIPLPSPPATPPTFLTDLVSNTVDATVVISSGNTIGRVSNAQSLTILNGAVIATSGIFASGTVTASNPTTASNTTTATFLTASPTITVTSATGLRVGDVVSGAGIPAGATITGISGTTITLSANTTAPGTSVSVTFTYTNLQFSAAVGVGYSDSPILITFINNKTATFSNNVSFTGTRSLSFVTNLTLTLSKNAEANGAQNLAYVFTRTLTLSQAALGTAEETLSYSFAPDSTATNVRVSSIEGLQPGMQVSGPGIPSGTSITSLQAPNTVVISQAPTATGSFMLEFFNTTPQLTFFSNFGSYAFFDQAARQQVPQWIMSGPATITYRWITQFHVMVSTSVQTAQDFPEVRKDPAVPVSADQPGFGNGEHWFDIGSTVFVGGKYGGGSNSRQINGWLNASVPPFPRDSGDYTTLPGVFIPAGGTAQSPNAFYYMQVNNLIAPIRVLWNYGSTIHRVLTQIGNSVNFSGTVPVLNGPATTPGTPLSNALNFPPDRAQVVEGPSGSAPDEMFVWDALAKKLYPLRPGKTLYEYGDQNNPVVVEVTSEYPTTVISHITHPDLPGVNLDPSAIDRLAWQRLAFSSGNGSEDGGSFLATQNGYSVLIFSERDVSDPSPANGNLNKETLVVKVVETKQWDEILGSAPALTAEIGTRLTRNLGPPSNDVLDTGFVVHSNARYNADIYDRTTILGSGPIIPVNRQFTGVPEDELVVIWYGKPDVGTGITWTHSVQRFAPQWPLNPPRIVIASRLGSEGKNATGQDQLVYARDKYSNVVVYNQPDRGAPGYNPNEEHALIAPSLKFQDQANPPPAAYALQSGLLNVTAQDNSHTSEPYVLVQYQELSGGETKMAVYALETEDLAPELNPWIDPRNQRAYNYTFNYTMTVGEPVQPPYPLGLVIGLNPPPDTFGVNVTRARVYWEDYNGVPYAAGQGAFNSHFFYRMRDDFWHGEGSMALAAGTPVPFGFAAAGTVVPVHGRINQSIALFYLFEGDPLFDSGVTQSAFNTGDRFGIGLPGMEVVEIAMTGSTVADFIRTVADAFPGGEVSALFNEQEERLELIAEVDTLTLKDFSTFNGNGGRVLEQAGLLPLSFSEEDLEVEVTSSTPEAAGFQPGATFTIDTSLPPGTAEVEITMTGVTTADFVQAINNAYPSGQVTAIMDTDNRVQISGSNVMAITFKDGEKAPLAVAGIVPRTYFAVQEVGYFARWPANPPILKAGETLTFAGGEFRADNPTYPGLPGVIGWGVGEVIYDSMNPVMRSVPFGGLPNAFDNYTARLISPLEPRRVSIGTLEEAQEIAEIIQPASGLTRSFGTIWKFSNLPASLSRRLFFDPLTRELGVNGYINDKTLGDSTLTAAPPPVYVLEPNIITSAERDEMLAIPELATNPAWATAVQELFRLCRNPNNVSRGAVDVGQTPYYAGLTTAYEVDPSTGELVLDTDGAPTELQSSAMNAKTYGPGLALVPSPAFLDPDSLLNESYVTLVENNDEDIGGPVTLRVIKVVKNQRFRGAIKTITSDNVFSEQLTMRHSGDFGGNADDIVYQWYYREEDGTEAPLPPHALWNLFPDDSNNEPRGLGQYQIELKGNPILLLADQLFFLRYRHAKEEPAGGPNSTNWADTKWEEYGSEWAGAANSRPGAYQPQLAMGWVKRVLDRINPYEARFNDFRNNDAPSTYVSMILQAGQRFEGPVALNPDKNVVENLGLIELYETVLERGRGLSIDLSTPVVTGGINNALLLAATRVTDLYMLLGNEAYSDAIDPTIGFGSNTADYGHAAANLFSFQNQLPSLLDEELALLRGRSQSYSRPVYNRLFWNFTKSEGEVAYAMNYNLTDINKDGFVDEKDAMIFYPQGHGDAWGHYLTAIKSQYNLLKHPYFNWVSRSEFYNLLDVVVEVDYYDERKFADAASARAKAGAEIVEATYRSRYVEDPDGQWQGYNDTDGDRAWGVDGWAKRAGQGAYLDWVTANAIIPAHDSREGLKKVDRTTVTAIHTVATQLAKIQATEDNSSSGLNPLGLSPDAVPMDFEPALAGPGGSSQFEQLSYRAEQAIQNAYHIFDNANDHSNRLRMQGVSAHDFSKQTFEQDRDYRNRLIEIFGTPYSGQIGPGKLYPTGYTGPDLALYMYVDVNDLNDETVPAPNSLFEDIWKSFPQMMSVDPKKFSLGATTPVDIGVNDGAFQTVFSQYFLADVIQPKADEFGNKLSDVFSPGNISTALDSITGVASYFNAMSLEMNLPISAAGYSFRAPEGWGMRSSPGELQAVISELVQAQAALGLAVGNYDYLLLDIQTAAQALRAQHGISTANVKVKDHVRNVTLRLNGVIAGLNLTKEIIEGFFENEMEDALAEFFPKSVGTSTDATSGLRGAIKLAAKAIKSNLTTIIKTGISATVSGMEIGRDDLGVQAELELEKFGYELEIQQKLKEIEMMLWNEASSRVEVFAKLEAMRQVSDRYRTVLGNGMALIDERADHNRQAAGAVQLMRYQDMAFRVFRNDSLQKYRAAFDLAQRYTYLAAKAYDYETNLAPTDPGSAQPMLQEIVRNRVLGDWYFGVTPAKGGLSEQLVKLRANYDVLKGRLGLNNPQIETSGFSLRREQAKTDAAGWKQLLQNSRTADLWEVPEFRRYCRPPRARSAGRLPGLVIPFSTETVFGRNFFGKALAGGDTAFNPTNFANKIAAAGVSFEGYPVASLAATPQVYLVPAGLDVMTIPNSLNLETRQWNVIDQALPVPFPVSSNNLANTDWVPVTDGLNGPLAAIRRFSSFRASVTEGEPPLSADTRLAGRSVWNTRWLLIIPGGSMLANGDSALDQFINRVTDINLYLDTYGYSGN
jgi:hypothetical protein